MLTPNPDRNPKPTSIRREKDPKIAHFHSLLNANRINHSRHLGLVFLVPQKRQIKIQSKAYQSLKKVFRRAGSKERGRRVFRPMFTLVLLNLAVILNLIGWGLGIDLIWFLR
jgi:hypothetical protein